MKRLPRAQRGLTIVELMIGLAIGLVVSLAASALYLASSETSRATKSLGDVNETGKLALDMIGRELEKAGFYPAQYPGDPAAANTLGAFYNGKAGAKPAYDNGLFGCDNAKFLPGTHVCDAAAANAPDSIVINYYATPEFGATSLMGNSNDCNRKAVSNDPDNAARAAAGQPLYVSNRFALSDTESFASGDVGNAKVTARSLACHGNGSGMDTVYEKQLLGIEDMSFRYGVTKTASNETPNEFLTATQVAALAVFGGETAWRSVTAVKVCIVVKSTDKGRTEDKTGSERTYVDCRGTTQTMPSADRAIYKRFERVFAVRNHLHKTL
jgi:type IV pilus assembly protein PilW